MRAEISEYRDNSSINYTLEDKSVFSDVGYKVLRNEDTDGFIKCVKISHNGKLKLVYDISGYKDLFSLVGEMSLDSFITVVSRLLSIVIGVKENGFMEYKNINPNINSIYVDTNNLNVYMIYLPLNCEGDKTEEVFVNELKNNIVQAMNLNRCFSGETLNILKNNLLSKKPIDLILRELNNRNRIGEVQQAPVDVTPAVKKKKSAFSAFEKLFSRKKQDKKVNSEVENIKSENDMVNKVDNQVRYNPQVEVPLVNVQANSQVQQSMQSYINSQPLPVEQDMDDEDTTLLDDGPSALVLKGINTPVALSLVINKSEYLIGSNKDMVDGHIGFNKAISRRHCKIFNINNTYYIQDVGSSNGTFVNSVRLQRDVMTMINVGDKITIANSEFMTMEV